MLETTDEAVTPPTTPADEPQQVKPLKLQWKRFVTATLSGENQTKAAETAGYSARSARQQGSVLMAQPAIIAAIDHYEQQAEAKTDLDQNWVIARLRLEATSMLNSGTDRIHSLDLLGKWLGMWAGEGSVTINLGGELEGLSTEQLRGVLEAMDKREALPAGEVSQSSPESATVTVEPVIDPCFCNRFAGVHSATLGCVVVGKVESEPVKSEGVSDE